MRVQVRYFAGMRAASGVDQEVVDVQSPDLPALYGQLQQRYGWRFDATAVRVAVNGALVGWNRALVDGDEIVFLPPFSGG